MKISIVRESSGEHGTFGRVYVDGVFVCHSLEDKDRRIESGGAKIPGESAIPRGIYKLIIDMSVRFKKLMMHILDVPQFSGIRIHSGNTHADTEGCILLGNGRANGYLIDSRTAVNKMFWAVERELKLGKEVIIEVS